MSNYDGSWPVNLGIPPTNTKYLQNIDYSYNIRGWLTAINDPSSCAIQSGDDLADLFSMGLDYESTANGAAAQYNGNIAAIQWNTNLNGVCNTRRLFRFTYDYADRFLSSAYYERVGTSWISQSKYSENSITYDLNGNFKTLLRRGAVSASVIDNLTYTYGDAARPDRLTNMTDAADAVKGFKYTSGAAAYQYDASGNLTQDNHKGFVFAYNYLNLPQSMTQSANVITLTYTADGEKLSKTLSGGGATKSYVSGIEYSGTNLEAIYFSEGRCTPNGAAAFYYEYTVKDHLGNARVSFRANGTTLTPLQENHYYAFGMEMEGSWLAQVGTENQYEYNGKELNEDFGLNLFDYGARWYDAAVGRWWSVDPMTEKYGAWSGYNYGMDNPIRFIDPDGMAVTTDYYNQQGKYLGTDGNENGRIVVVTNKKEAKSISKADKKGGTTQESDVKSGVALPSPKIREGMGRAVERAGSPSNHEEGGVFGTDYEGNEVVVDAKPGPESTSDKGAEINVFDSADGQPDIKTIEGTFHTHPDGTTVTGTRDFDTFSSQSITYYRNEPSADHDIKNAKARGDRGSVKGNSYVLAQGNQTVYVYNGSGTVATFPLPLFVSIGVKK